MWRNGIFGSFLSYIRSTNLENLFAQLFNVGIYAKSWHTAYGYYIE